MNIRAWAIAIVLGCCSIESASAQIVRIGPWGGVRVRVPFVGVDVGPFGGTRVRAPFTAVDTGYWGWGRGPVAPYRDPVRYRWEPAYSDYRSYSSDPYSAMRPGRSPAEMNWGELREYLRAVTRRLESSLARRSDADTWRRRLRPGTIADLVAGTSNVPPDSETAERLEQILAQYWSTEDPAIRNLEGFEEVAVGLEEFTSPPLLRQQRALAASAARLHNDLNRFRTGHTWQRYLTLPEELVDERAAVSPTDLDETLQRYERVVTTPDYRNIANLASFQQTHALLRQYARLLDASEPSSPTDMAPERAPSELLPPPRPAPER